MGTGHLPVWWFAYTCLLESIHCDPKLSDPKVKNCLRVLFDVWGGGIELAVHLSNRDFRKLLSKIRSIHPSRPSASCSPSLPKTGTVI